MTSSVSDPGPVPVQLSVAVLTISDTRSLLTDSSGQLLADFVTSAGHRLVERFIVRDEVAAIRNQAELWVALGLDVILLTGGTGITERDVTPEALAPLLTKEIPGFGELFRMLSYAEIGAATIQSRAFAGLARKTLLFALPGSTGAVRLAVEKIIGPQLDSRTRPCNFVDLLQRTPQAGLSSEG